MQTRWETAKGPNKVFKSSSHAEKRSLSNAGLAQHEQSMVSLPSSIYIVTPALDSRTMRRQRQQKRDVMRTVIKGEYNFIINSNLKKTIVSETEPSPFFTPLHISSLIFTASNLGYD